MACPHLTDLSVAYCDHLTDSSLQWLCLGATQLTRLNVVACWRLSAKALFKVFSHCKFIVSIIAYSSERFGPMGAKAKQRGGRSVTERLERPYAPTERARSKKRTPPMHPHATASVPPYMPTHGEMTTAPSTSYQQPGMSYAPNMPSAYPPSTSYYPPPPGSSGSSRSMPYIPPAPTGGYTGGFAGASQTSPYAPGVLGSPLGDAPRDPDAEAAHYAYVNTAPLLD
jgi:hypothetical protein